MYKPIKALSTSALVATHALVVLLAGGLFLSHLTNGEYPSQIELITPEHHSLDFEIEDYCYYDTQGLLRVAKKGEHWVVAPNILNTIKQKREI